MVIENKLFEVKNISFDYDGEEIFSDISFSIESGDVLCILGPNGTGKTTLIKCLNGLNEINSGEILINGENINKLKGIFSDDGVQKLQAQIRDFEKIIDFLNFSGIRRD